MFQQLQVEIMERFTALEAYFRASRRFKRDAVMSATAKGLAFVQIYAVYEFTVVSAVREAIDSLHAHGHNYSELSSCLLALFLNPELQSLRDCPEKDVWAKRINLFEKANSSRPATVQNDVLPIDGSHFKHTQLKMIFRVLGIQKTPARRRRHLFKIDEIVNNRNAIAHGRETADAVGRRYSRREIAHSIRQMKSVCLYLPFCLEQHCIIAEKHRK